PDEGGARYLVVGGHGADDGRAALLVDAAQRGDARQVDQRRRVGEALLHGGDQRVAAGQQLGLAAPRQQLGRVSQRLRAMIFEGVHGLLLLGGHLGGGFLRRAPNGERRRRHGDLLVAQRIGDGVDDGGGCGNRAGLAAAL